MASPTETVARLARYLDPEAWQAVARLEDAGAKTPPLGYKTGTVSSEHQALGAWQMRKEESIEKAKAVLRLLLEPGAEVKQLFASAAVGQPVPWVQVWQRALQAAIGQ